MLKPRPTSTAPSSSQRTGWRALSTALITAQAAPSRQSASRLSMVLLRLVTTLIGVTASAAAASSPAAGPQGRRPGDYRRRRGNVRAVDDGGSAQIVHGTATPWARQRALYTPRRAATRATTVRACSR